MKQVHKINYTYKHHTLIYQHLKINKSNFFSNIISHFSGEYIQHKREVWSDTTETTLRDRTTPPSTFNKHSLSVDLFFSVKKQTLLST